MNVALVALAVALAAIGVALFPVGRRLLARATVIGLFALLAIAPAVAGFTANPNGHPHPSQITPFSARSLPAMSLASPNCQWAGANIQVNVVPLGAGSSWVGGTQLLRSTNGGSFGQVALRAYNASSLTDTTVTNQPANTYTYKVNAFAGTIGAWTGADSATVASTSCVNRINTLQAGTTTAAMHATNGVAVDAPGNVAFTDTTGHRVGYVPATSGTYFGIAMTAGYMYSIAGNGSAGYSGDNGGAATGWKVNSPEGIAFDSNGNVLFADTGNHVVRVVNKGTANASFFGTTAIDPGEMMTVAGTGAIGNTGDGESSTGANTKLSSPKGVAFDSSGDLIIADTGNNRLRMVTMDANNHFGANPAMHAANHIWNLAGSAGGTSGSTNAYPATSASFSGPQQVQLDGAGDIYVADTGNATVRKVPASVATTTVAGQAGLSGTSGDGGPAPSARLGTAATGIAVDTTGTVYIADSTNSNVRAVCQTVNGCTIFGKSVPNGYIDSVVGTGSNGYTGEGYPVSVTVADTTTMISKLSAPKGVSFDPATGALYIADSGNNMIRKVVSDTTTQLHLATSGLSLLSAVAGSGTSGWTEGVPAASAASTSPESVAVDASGNMYFVDKGDHRVREYVAATGQVATIMGIGLSGSTGDGGWAVQARLASPEGIAVDANGVVYVADTGNNKIRAICPYGHVGNCSVLNVTIGPGQVQVVAGGSLTAGSCPDGTPATNTGCKLNTPKGVEVDSAGDLYVADANNNSIKWVANSAYGSNAYGKSTPVSQYAMYNIAAPASSAPVDVAVDGSKNVYFADASAVRIKQIAWSNGSATNIAGTGSAGHSGDGGAATSAAISAAVTGLAIDGSTVYFADNQLYIRRVTGGTMYAVGGNGNSGITGDWAGASAAPMVPFGVAAMTSGDVYFAGGTTTNVQLRKIKGPTASS